MRRRSEAARACGGRARGRAGGEHAVAPPRPAGRKTGRAAGHDAGGGRSRRDGARRPGEPAGGRRAAGSRARCDRPVGGRWRPAHGAPGPGRPRSRRRDRGGAGVAAREPAPGRPHAGDRAHGARPRRRAAPQRERGRGGGGRGGRGARGGAAVRIRCAGRAGRRRRPARPRRGRRRDAHRARRRDGRHDGEAARRGRGAPRRRARRPHRGRPYARASFRRHPRPRRRSPAGVTSTTAAEQSAARAASALLDVYARVGPLFVRGEGAELIADDGTRYLDLVAGIAVNALGYDHPVIRDAIDQALASGLIHVSNLYRTEPGERLAEELVARSFASRVFFCNSGAEANEAAFKFARKWSGKSEIVAFTGSFHGRLFASLAATDRPEYRKPFEPLVPGVRIVPREDWAAVDHAISASRTAAVIVEPLQGEGGVRPVDPEWLAFVRELCAGRGVALIFDEVQCGLGRTGTLFAYEQAEVVPDMLTLAKPLAGGLPMGAVLLTDGIAAALKPGDHATTFGGGPLVARVALAVVRTIPEPGCLGGRCGRRCSPTCGRSSPSWPRPCRPAICCRAAIPTCAGAERGTWLARRSSRAARSCGAARSRCTRWR